MSSSSLLKALHICSAINEDDLQTQSNLHVYKIRAGRPAIAETGFKSLHPRFAVDTTDLVPSE